eukprot:1259413-Rhodomonas_salina.2
MGSVLREEERGRDGARAERGGAGKGERRDGARTERRREGRDGTRAERGREGKRWGAQREGKRLEGVGKGMVCTPREEEKGRDGVHQESKRGEGMGCERREEEKVDLQTMQVVSTWVKKKRKGQTKGSGS